MDAYFHPTLYNGYDYLSVLWFKLIHVDKWGPSNMTVITSGLDSWIVRISNESSSLAKFKLFRNGRYYVYEITQYKYALLVKQRPSRKDRLKQYENYEHIAVASLWARWRLKSPALRLLAQLFIQVQITENIKVPRHWPLWWIPRTNGR